MQGVGLCVTDKEKVVPISIQQLQFRTILIIGFNKQMNKRKRMFSVSNANLLVSIGKAIF